VFAHKKTLWTSQKKQKAKQISVCGPLLVYIAAPMNISKNKLGQLWDRRSNILSKGVRKQKK
jgi:hypothetical protein